MKKAFLLSLASLSLFFLEACASAKPAIITSEHTLHVAADLFQETARIMDRAQESGAISVEQYRSWRTFGEKFKVSYPLALKALDIAIQTESQADVKSIHEIIGNLVSELGRWYVEASIAFSTRPDGGAQ